MAGSIGGDAMGRSSETIMQEAFGCFWPPLSDEAKPVVRAALENLAQAYRFLAKKDVKGFLPIKGDNEPMAEYEARCWEQLAPVREGRPRDFAADLLVCSCRKVLIQNGCNYSSPHNRKKSSKNPLADLAALVHELSGLPPRRGWRSRAENASNPAWRLQLRYGDNFDLSATPPEWKETIASLEERPPKREKRVSPPKS